MRQHLLEGRLPLPSRNAFVSAIGEQFTCLTEHMFKSLWHNYLRNKGSISLPYWSDKFNNAKVFNLVLKSLSEAGWVVSHAIPARNWAEANLNELKLLEYCTQKELNQVRAHNKFACYRLNSSPSTKASSTRINGRTANTGLTRLGFMEAGNSRFTYDQDSMYEYRDVIQANLTKSMDKIAEMNPSLRHDEASYDTISVEILNFHLTTDETFTRGSNENDSRGRAISNCLSKVANPISCKDFRAMLVIPEA